MPLASDDRAPITNGTVRKEGIAPICAGLAGKVNSFLEETDGGELLGQVRAQTRGALGVIERALGMYRFVCLFILLGKRKGDPRAPGGRGNNGWPLRECLLTMFEQPRRNLAVV